MIYFKFTTENKYRFIFATIFFILNINLIINTEFNKIDYREYAKILIPTLVLYVTTYLNKVNNRKLFNFLYYILLIHLMVAFIYQILIHNSLFQITSDHRYFLPLLGRSAGETALAFFVLNLATYFYIILNNLGNYNNLYIFLFFLTFNICVITQSRTWLLMLLLYSLIFYILSENRKKITTFVSSKNKIILLYTFFTILIMGHLNYFGEILKRMEHSLLSGRVEIWNEYLHTHGNKSAFNIVLGENLERKTLVNIEHGIETSDSHNLFFDISQTFGVLGLFFLLGSYLFSIKNAPLRLFLPIVLVFLFTGLLMSPFKVPYLFYTNVIMLIIPIILSKKT